MKLYIAYKDTDTLIEGTYSNIIGVFDSDQKAWDALSKDNDFQHAIPSKFGNGKVYHFDGELSYYYHVKPMELNKSLLEEIV